MRGRRLGKQLLEIGVRGREPGRLPRMTLFVGGRNSRARSLYEASRFRDDGQLYGGGNASAAPVDERGAGGVVMTRR